MKSLSFLVATFALFLDTQVRACPADGNSCREVKVRTKNALLSLEKANKEGLGSSRVSCLSGENPLVKISRCAEIAKGQPEDKCLADYKFTATYGKAESECKKSEGSLPLFEVVELNPGHFVIRQNKCSSVEAPFMYLMVGEKGAFLHDTGAHDESGVGEIGSELRKLVEEVLARKSAQVGHPIDLTVGHGHSHGDHMAGDSAFKSPETTSSGGKINVVGGSPDDVAKAFNIPKWGEDVKPDDSSVGSIDLGGRKISVVAIPGHESSSVAYYDHSTGDLYTGDSLYPGNVFTNGNWEQHKQSTARLSKFINNLPAGSRPVRMVLGSHIEHSNEGKDLGWGNPNQPNEHSIVLRKSNLEEMNNYLQDPKTRGVEKVFPDFSIRN